MVGPFNGIIVRVRISQLTYSTHSYIFREFHFSFDEQRKRCSCVSRTQTSIHKKVRNASTPFPNGICMIRRSVNAISAAAAAIVVTNAIQLLLLFPFMKWWMQVNWTDGVFVVCVRWRSHEYLMIAKWNFENLSSAFVCSWSMIPSFSFPQFNRQPQYCINRLAVVVVDASRWTDVTENEINSPFHQWSLAAPLPSKACKHNRTVQRPITNTAQTVKNYILFWSS